MASNNLTIFWFRRDLRLEDNVGLFHALSGPGKVLPIFIFDKEILEDLPKKDPRIEFILDRLSDINQKLEAVSSSIKVIHDTPREAFESLINELDIGTVYTNRDYEPYAAERDEDINNLLESNGIEFKSYQDHLIFEPGEVLKDDGSPYTVYTPFSRKWKYHLESKESHPVKSEALISNFLERSAEELPKIESLGFEKSGIKVREIELDPARVKEYENTRDYPSKEGGTYAGPHLRFGTYGIRTILKKSESSDTLRNELIWREFFTHILFHFPRVVGNSFKRNWDQIKWENDPEKVKAWKEGKTGFPMVDAGIRELNRTGYMHNRVRMITANFLVKLLRVDWRVGEAYFAEKLLDFELASNNGNWQWSAGSGCDAAPYFRIFNPETQIAKFDPKHGYIKKWIPEFGTPDYPAPIIDYSKERSNSLSFFESYLKKN